MAAACVWVLQASGQENVQGGDTGPVGASATAGSAAAAVAPATTPTVVPEVTAVLAQKDAAYRALAAAVFPSIVTVSAYAPPAAGAAGAHSAGMWAVADETPHPGLVRLETCSGLVLDAQGTILCCRTPLLQANGAFAEIVDVESTDGTRLEATLLACEPTINLAVLQVKLPSGALPSDMKPLHMGNILALQPGDALVACADPFGSARTLAPGVVMSVPMAACYQADVTGSLLHGSMVVSQGAMGGALVNAAGQVVAMIVPTPPLDPQARTTTPTYTTFGMQIQTAVAVGAMLKHKRTTESPWLGFSVLSQQELQARMRDPAAFGALPKPEHGLLVDDLYTPSPAAAAGVQRGDWVVEIGGIPIFGVTDFQQALYYFSGTQVPIRFFSQGQMVDRVVPIERRPPEANRSGK